MRAGTNGNIMTALALRDANTTLWDVMRQEAAEWDAAQVKAVCHEMLQERAAALCAPS